LKLISVMAEHGFDPRRLELEVTETALLVDFDSARKTIAVLRAAGVRIVLDDFGTGYSSIGYMGQIAFDVIKIGGTVVEPIVRSDHGRALLKGVLELCTAIGAPCVAEGWKVVPI
jgi:EAL domain-containing protein (putative c-di-GMP-specific phosphodiesterase class I)